MSFREELLRRIAVQGPMPVSEYMRLCLVHYYGSRDPFGAGGDFTTAPEISQIFGELAGAWIAAQWQMQGGLSATLVELGPGRGTLMADALRATRHVPGFHEAIRIRLVETSPALREKQRAMLTGMHPEIEWAEAVEPLPSGPVFVIANEFFDCLPVRQFVAVKGEWRERGMGLGKEGMLALTLLPPSPSPLAGRGEAACEAGNSPSGRGGGASLLWSAASPPPPPNHSGSFLLRRQPPFVPQGEGEKSRPPAKEIEIREECPEGTRLMKLLTRHIATHGGAALIADYGYGEGAEAGTHSGDTLQALYRHGYADLLADPGEADLTAHVDFAALLRAGSGAGVRMEYATQGDFLRRSGVELRADALCKNAEPSQREEILRGLERLISPAKMGELFKMLLVTKG